MAIARRVSSFSSGRFRPLDEVVACWRVGGGFDYILQIVTRDIDAYQRLVDHLLEARVGLPPVTAAQGADMNLRSAQRVASKSINPRPILFPV
ncbi:Lrp/AsnC ligand binding domain-containing protein [Mesorhizobium sp.]|uniref:Lrp/AsnC ligand binding domain-containing protein n=1 Tax=Mesorhizobium sp. TaxID=1871066 RepID=UPI0034502F65